MIKKLLLGLTLVAFVSTSFAGFSGGGRSGFSGGSRSFSSGSYSRSYSSGRSGYARSTNTARAYVAPRRSYSGVSRSYSGSNTVIHNNHYSHGGYGGGGFFSGFLGGYLGGSMANHGTTVVTGGVAPVVGSGQGMIVEGGVPVVQHDLMGTILGGILVLALLMALVIGFIALCKALFSNNHGNRW